MQLLPELTVLAKGQSIMRKRESLNFNNIPQRFSDFFGKKSAIGIEVYRFGM